MVVKDKLARWFLQNIMLPQIDVWNNPGFVITQYTEKGRKIFLREVFIPEKLLVEIENKFSSVYKIKGKKALYSAGKKFGYIFAKLSNFPKNSELNDKQFLDFIYQTVRYVESTYAEKIQHTVDIKSKIFDIEMNNYIVCRKNGLGFLLGEGGITGIWSYMNNDKNIEGKQLTCTYSGSETCKIICAPSSVLVNRHIKSFKEPRPDIKNIESDSIYQNFNAPRKTTFETRSLKELIDSKRFSYEKGVLKFKEERYAYVDTSLIYIIEQELSKFKSGKKILFDIGFDIGYETIDVNQNKDFIRDYISALGFGEINFMNEILSIKYFPWLKLYKNIDFCIIRGLVSGMLSKISGEKILLKKVEKNISEGFLEIILKQ